MEEKTNTTKSQQTPEQQPNPDQKLVLMPGQDHEDELDFLGGALFGLVSKGYNRIKNLFRQQKAK